MARTYLLAIAMCVLAVASAQISFKPGSRPNSRPPNRHRPNTVGGMSPRPHSPSAGEKTSGCNCVTQCGGGLGQRKTACLSDSGRQGICCIDQTAVVTRVGFSSSGVRPRTFSSNMVSTGMQRGREFFQTLLSNEKRRLRAGKFLKPGEPARGHAFFFARTASARAIHDRAYTIARSSVEIAKLERLSPAESFFNLPGARVGDSERGFECPMDNVPQCDGRAKFRTIDGSCNNLGNPFLGRSETAFGRLSPAIFEDGIIEPRITGVDDEPLPNVRTASSNVLIDIDQPDRETTLAVMQWAQFVDHDLTLAPFNDMDGEAIQCCENGQVVSDLPEECFPIMIPRDDAFYHPKGQACLNFVTSMLALRPGCPLGPVEQLNVLTHYLDGSMIYGSTAETLNSVADLATGFMRISANNLPPTNSSVDCEAREGDRFPCFVGGDSRIQEQPGLTVEHTMWIREHNRIAKILKQLNRGWSPTRLFEETRRIVVAIVQHITFGEWLPIIIGRNKVQQLGIATLSSGFRQSYSPSVNPVISNEFATGAFRFGHSMVQGFFKLQIQGRSSSFHLRNGFNNPAVFQRNPEFIEGFISSFTNQPSQTLDSKITAELSNHLFQTPGLRFGMDLMSLNLQRGREHGIATYNQIRLLFGPGRAQNFLDLQNTHNSDAIQRLQIVYRNIDDIDFFLGGITETPIADGLLGPTFASVIGDQFKRLVNGDRFFYDNGGQAGSFTPDQLAEIRKSSLSRIYCDNSEIGMIQPLAFKPPSRSNPRGPCQNLPSIDLRVFQE